MDKEKIIELIEKNHSTRSIALELKTSQSNIRYWLKKYELKTKQTAKLYNTLHKCNSCEENNPEELVKDRNICKNCRRITSKKKYNYTTFFIKKIKFKQKCIEYLGGECSICGYKKYLSALCFHHVNSYEKEYTISTDFRGSTNLTEKVKKELDKCIVLCSNCHSEMHEKETLESKNLSLEDYNNIRFGPVI